MSTPQMPSASGVRSAGDDYHYLHGWRLCIQLLLEDRLGHSRNPGTHIGIEVPHVGNADDLIYYRTAAPHTYYQVKYAADASTPLSLGYLTDNDLLKKMAASHTTITANGDTAELRLLTNRLIDPTDVLMQDLDDRTLRLVPRGLQGGPQSNRGKARTQWLTASGLATEADLHQLLEALHFEPGYKPDMLRTNISHMMTAAGLRADDTAINLGKDWVNQRVIDGHRNQTVADITAALDSLNLHAGSPWATISIATLSRDPLAGQAVVAIDWVDNMDGDEPFNRVQPAPPHTWNELAAELDAIPNQIGNRSRIMVTGTMRQATGFKVGTVLRQVLGYDVAIRQRDQLWTGAETTTPYSLTNSAHDLDAGNDIAVIVNVATDATEAATTWMQSAALPVGKIHAISPKAGLGPNALPTPQAANSLAVAVRNTVRNSLPANGDVHLFLAGPGGLALLLGHHWNRLARTHVYEHIRGSHYSHAYTVQA